MIEPRGAESNRENGSGRGDGQVARDEEFNVNWHDSLEYYMSLELMDVAGL
jgi:hypothetical protein